MVIFKVYYNVLPFYNVFKRISCNFKEKYNYFDMALYRRQVSQQLWDK